VSMYVKFDNRPKWSTFMTSSEFPVDETYTVRMLYS
jgi:hypothetical protein